MDEKQIAELLERVKNAKKNKETYRFFVAFFTWHIKPPAVKMLGGKMPRERTGISNTGYITTDGKIINQYNIIGHLSGKDSPYDDAKLMNLVQFDNVEDYIEWFRLPAGTDASEKSEAMNKK